MVREEGGGESVCERQNYGRMRERARERERNRERGRDREKERAQWWIC